MLFRSANARLRTQPHEILIAADGIARAVERDRFLIELERLNPVDRAATGPRDSEAIILIVDAPGIAMDSVATQIGPADGVRDARLRIEFATRLLARHDRFRFHRRNHIERGRRNRLGGPAILHRPPRHAPCRRTEHTATRPNASTWGK